MFTKYTPGGFKSPMVGIELKTMVYGQNTLLTRFHLKKGALIPLHSHPHEQTGFLVSGRIKFFFDHEEYLAEPGDSWCVGGGLEHKAEILEDSVVVEVFSPLREDYLPD